MPKHEYEWTLSHCGLRMSLEDIEAYKDYITPNEWLMIAAMVRASVRGMESMLRDAEKRAEKAGKKLVA